MSFAVPSTVVIPDRATIALLAEGITDETNFYWNIDNASWDKDRGMIIRNGEALLSKFEFEALPEYSHSLPTGTVIGKRWKANKGANSWYMGEYTRFLPILTCCRYHRCIVGVKDERDCHPVIHHTTGQVYDPANPEVWPEAPVQHVEIRWTKISLPPSLVQQLE